MLHLVGPACSACGPGIFSGAACGVASSDLAAAVTAAAAVVFDSGRSPCITEGEALPSGTAFLLARM